MSLSAGSGGDAPAIVDEPLHRARVAQREFDCFDQKHLDDAVAGIAWAIYQPGRARHLAAVARYDVRAMCRSDKPAPGVGVADTGTGRSCGIHTRGSYRRPLDITRLARVTGGRLPTEDEPWGSYFARYGR